MKPVISASNQLGLELKRSKYRLLGLVGQGQFGRVYCAIHRQTGRLVALKNLEQQRFPTHKFLRELRFLLALQHPNIVTCQALEHSRAGRYLVMDYCEGGTLRTLMEGEGRLCLPQSLKLVADILAGLDHAHNRGIVHCDIKPDNILLRLQPWGWIARVSDFGIAKLMQELVGQQGDGNTGSPAYMAPERFYGQYSQASDLYSVGILLFELLAGERPFSGTPLELMSAHLNQPLRMPEAIPQIWQPVISTALQKLVARRFRSAKDMLAAIRAIAEQEGFGTWVTNQTIHLPLLQPNESFPSLPFPWKPQEVLSHPIDALMMDDRSTALLPSPQHSAASMLVRAEGSRLVVQPRGDEIPPAATEDTKLAIALQEPIQSIWLRPQGCYAVTCRAVHLISLCEANVSQQVKQIAQLPHDFIGTVDPMGGWLATASQNSDRAALQFWQLPNAERSGSVSSQPIHWQLPHPETRIVDLVALDSRHLMIVSVRHHSTTKTTFGVWTRRGTRVGALTIPLRIGQIFTTPSPYRLLAIDRDDAQSILLIDLKPYRVLRFGLPIVPRCCAATSWGYILMDERGQMVFLDECGQQISRLEGPSYPTAIACSRHNHLSIATWNGTQGCLYTESLVDLGVDLVI